MNLLLRLFALPFFLLPFLWQLFSPLAFAYPPDKINQSAAFYPPPHITAETAAIIDLKKGSVIWATNYAKVSYPASLTKILTALLAIEYGHPSRLVIIGEAEAAISYYLNAGDVIPLNELIIEMLMISDNGAAEAIARTVSGSRENFARLMNERAAAIGAISTHFANPSGLPDDTHFTTAADISRIAQEAMKNPLFRSIVATRSRHIHCLKPTGRKIFCENTNELLGNYIGCNGIKTGYTEKAGYCLAAAAIREGRELLVIVLNAASSEERFSEAAALLDYGFSLTPKELP